MSRQNKCTNIFDNVFNILKSSSDALDAPVHALMLSPLARSSDFYYIRVGRTRMDSRPGKGGWWGRRMMVGEVGVGEARVGGVEIGEVGVRRGNMKIKFA